jgi:hypothetical protein
LAFSIAALLAVTTSDAAAQRARRRFEPTDLNLQHAGTVEIDTQVGVIRGEDGTRTYLPDFEASIGISSQLELEVDGAFGLAGAKPQFLDNTLLAMRLAVLDVRDSPTSTSAWAAGVQAGPRLPTALGTRGLGVEALAIAGRTAGRLHLFVQGGTLLDPFQAAPGARASRPFGVEGGLDLDLDLDDKGAWSLKGELGGVKFFSADRSQLHLTAGPALWVVPWLELSVVGVLGFLPGGDHYGGLLGAATRFSAF